MSDDVVYPWSEVIVNGRSLGVHPVKISAAIANDLPGRLNFGSGITQRTGTITWDRAIGKDGLLLSPLRRVGENGFMLPSPSDRVVIRMGVQSQDPREVGLVGGEVVFTGKVDYSEVTHGGYPVTHIVDDIDRLNRVVRFPAYRHHMPPKPNGGGRYRHNNFTPDSLLGFIAQACGYHVTAPPSGTVYLNAPLQGTLMPYPGRGELVASELARGSGGEIPAFEGTPHGLGLTSGAGDWDVLNRATPQRLVVSIWVGKAHASNTFIFARLANGTELRVRIDATRKVHVAVGETYYPTGITATDQYVSVALKPDGTAEAKTDTGQANVRTATWQSASITGVSLDAPAGSHLAGLNICGTDASATAHPATTFTPNAYIKAGYPYPLHLARSIRDEKAIDVIKEICEAICCVCYLDGEGKLVIEYGRSAYGRPTAGTLSVKRALKSYQVRDDSQLAARNVIIKYLAGDGSFTNRSGGSYVDIWEGSSRDLEPGSEDVTIFGPGDDEEWLEVDESFTYANGNDEVRADFAAKNGSFSGFTLVSGDASTKTERWGGGTVRLQKIVPWRYKLTMNPHNPSSTRVPEVDTVPKHMWGTGMPKVRGGARLEFVDAEPVVVTGGDSSAADLIHEAGKWVTDTRAEDIARFAARYSQKPLPVLTGVQCFFDPSIRVNHRWNIDLTETVGVRLLCFVLGVEHDPASDTTSLTVRVLEDLSPWVWASLPEKYRTFEAVTNDFVTYEDLKAGK